MQEHIISVIRYRAGNLKCTLEETKHMCRKSIQLLMMNGVYEQRADTDRLCMKSENGDRKLISVEDGIRIKFKRPG